MRELGALFEAADAADGVIRSFFRNKFSVSIKADGSKVTSADTQAELAVLTVLKRHFPDYGFLSEESGTSGDQKNRWIVDPLDGTNSFIRGLPFCGSLLAFETDGVVRAGVVSLPLLGERIWASKGKGCFWNGTRCKVSNTRRLEDAYFNMERTKSFREGYGVLLDELTQQVHQERGYADAYGYFCVATGLTDAFIEGKASFWDYAAPKICVEEAGGALSAFQGKRNGLLVASNAKLCSLIKAYFNESLGKVGVV